MAANLGIDTVYISSIKDSGPIRFCGRLIDYRVPEPQRLGFFVEKQTIVFLNDF